MFLESHIFILLIFLKLVKAEPIYGKKCQDKKG